MPAYAECLKIDELLALRRGSAGGDTILRDGRRADGEGYDLAAVHSAAVM
jgi:hypothetical protein